MTCLFLFIEKNKRVRDYLIFKTLINIKQLQTYPDEPTYEINGETIEVHPTLGPGLLEKVHQSCLKKV